MRISQVVLLALEYTAHTWLGTTPKISIISDIYMTHIGYFAAATGGGVSE